MENGQKENYLWRKDKRRITFEGRIEGELLMEDGQKENYLWRKDKGELLMEEGQKENYLWMKDRRRITYGGRIEQELEDIAQLFAFYNQTVEGICCNYTLIKQLARWNNMEKTEKFVKIV